MVSRYGQLRDLTSTASSFTDIFESDFNAEPDPDFVRAILPLSPPFPTWSLPVPLSPFVPEWTRLSPFVTESKAFSASAPFESDSPFSPPRSFLAGGGSNSIFRVNVEKLLQSRR